MKIRIEVTQEDIEHGTPRECQRCPIALAARRLFSPYVEYLGVAPNDIIVTQKDRRIRALTPQAVKDWMIDYDNGREVHPFTFEADFR